MTDGRLETFRLDFTDRVGRYACRCGGTITFPVNDTWILRGECDTCPAFALLDIRLRWFAKRTTDLTKGGPENPPPGLGA